MKFYLADGVTLELAPEISNNVIVISTESFLYNGYQYGLSIKQFKIDDAYFMLYEMVRNNPGKKIFVHHFERLANDFYAMYYAVEV